MTFNLSEKVSELIIREGEAPKILPELAPIKTGFSGVLNTPFAYLDKRAETGQFDLSKSILFVDREKLSLELRINEDDPYKVGSISGSLTENSKFKEFGINGSKVWTPSDLGLFIKMNRSFFPDKAVAMQLTTDLMNFIGKVENQIEKKISEKGDKTDHFAQVVNSNIPSTFKIKIPIFKGYPAEELEVETFANIDGRSVSFRLISPGAMESLESIRDTAIDAEISKISEKFPALVIIEK